MLLLTRLRPQERHCLWSARQHRGRALTLLLRPEGESLVPLRGPAAAGVFSLWLAHGRAASYGLDGNRLDHCRVADPMASPPFNLGGAPQRRWTDGEGPRAITAPCAHS